MIDLDHNATTRPLPAVVAAMVRAMEGTWANPSSMHEPGQAARRALAEARARVAALLGCQPVELVFTSGATEANHQAVLGALARGRALGRTRLVVSAVEHAGLLALVERLQREGTPVDRIPVDGEGRLDLDAAARLIGPDVALLSVMAANNETGVWHPLAELSALARAQEVPFHVDATQAVGKSLLRFDASGADLWSCSAHKLHGPQGVGALVVRKGLAWPALIEGKQERKRRGGTENGPGIAGFAAAAEVLGATLAEDVARMTDLRQTLEQGLLALHPAIALLGQGAERMPNTVCVRFGERDAEQVLGKLERAGVVASSGAACGAGSTQPSHVMLAMGLTPAQAKAEVRFSLGRDTTAQDIGQALAAVRTSVLPLLLEDQALATAA
ncbi:cysteine desulfurase [Ideonella sp. B7]|uniref:cysteine desulfurase family protein n=1 Tax=Ideonella benzenivorans TaxID=2831643 RepID=UPI001CED8009|nr:cysteine desulfurase family protein [Ideonella benzenivorans]MCA6218612.1 cysteine desulfurase [Ideonella benzenivorans]